MHASCELLAEAGRLVAVPAVHRQSPALRAAAVLAALVLAGCTGAAAHAPDWRPQKSFQGEGSEPSIVPALPVPSGRTVPNQPVPGPFGPSGSTSPSGGAKQDPNVVATRLTAPLGIALLPDGTALVGERTTGRIVRVQPRPGRPVSTVRTVPGLDATGDGGLLDLAISPHYGQDKLVFAYLTTATDNRVVTFTLTGPVTAVLTGIPKGATGNTGRIAFGPDGYLYVGTGDAGQPAAASDPTSLAGKVLRVSDVGAPAPGNPNPSSPVFTSGHRDVDGLCLDPGSGSMLEVESRASGDPVNLLTPAATFGWPAHSNTDRVPLRTLPAADRGPGGCAVAASQLYVTSLDGRALLTAQLSASGSPLSVGVFTASLIGRYGRLRTVVAAPDGALWLTTSNRDGLGSPVSDDERVLRILPAGGTATSPV